MSIDPRLCEILVCPACRGDLRSDGETGLACRACGRVYPIRDGIPVMLVEEASPPSGETRERAPGSGPGP